MENDVQLVVTVPSIVFAGSPIFQASVGQLDIVHPLHPHRLLICILVDQHLRPWVMAGTTITTAEVADSGTIAMAALLLRLHRHRLLRTVEDPMTWTDIMGGIWIATLMDTRENGAAPAATAGVKVGCATEAGEKVETDQGLDLAVVLLEAADEIEMIAGGALAIALVAAEAAVGVTVVRVAEAAVGVAVAAQIVRGTTTTRLLRAKRRQLMLQA